MTSDQRYIIKCRNKIFDLYGKKCVCCGETRREFLTVSHPDNNGAEHRKKIKGGNAFLVNLIRNNHGYKIEILCWNCNCAMAYQGYCPHKRQTSQGTEDSRFLTKPCISQVTLAAAI